MDEFRNALPESGVYHYPGMPHDQSEASIDKVNEDLKKGRITMLVYKKEPTSLFEPSAFAGGLLLNFLTAVLTFLVVSRLQDKSFQSVLMTCLFIGLMVVLVKDFSLMNWFMVPLDFTLAYVFDIVIAFGLLGLLFGAYTFKDKVITA